MVLRRDWTFRSHTSHRVREDLNRIAATALMGAIGYGITKLVEKIPRKATRGDVRSV